MKHRPPHDWPLVIANVVAMRSTAVGDYVYRVSQPALAMGRLPGVRVLTVKVTSPYLRDVCQAADVLILHLLSEEDFIPIIAERRRRHLPTVYEISDNFLAAHSEVGIHGWFAEAANRASALHLCRMADAVQVTGPGLQARFGHLNPRTVVIENQMARLGAAPRAPGPLVRLGWAGSSGHREDLRASAAAIAAVCSEHPAVRFAFMGDRRLYDELFGTIPAAVKSHTPPGSLDDYLGFLETVDIGVAPLLPTAYNDCRSDVKFLEYASRGAAPVLARAAPYLAHARDGDTALMFGDDGELVGSLHALIGNGARRVALAERAQSYVGRARLEEAHASSRVDFYRSLGASPHERALTVPATRLDGDSESYDVTEAPEESLLIAGIRAATSGDRAGAGTLFERAAAARPGYALPLYWWGRIEERAGDLARAAALYQRALAVDPRSPRARLRLARTLEATGALAPAVAAMQAVVAEVGDHAPTLVAAGALCEALGQRRDAATLYRNALGADADYEPAAVALGRV